MADIGPYLRSAAFGTEVTGKTGNVGDGVIAGGYAAFIDSITGDSPQLVTRKDGSGYDVVQTDTQNKMIANWVEAQTLDSIFHRKPAGKVSYVIGPAFTPVAVKYAIPVTAVIFTVGLLVGRMMR